jgi:hypothetical protein
MLKDEQLYKLKDKKSELLNEIKNLMEDLRTKDQ